MRRYIKIALFVIVGILGMGQVKADEPRLLPIYSVYSQEKKIALTFDCAWGASDIPEILSILKENEVPATFFMVGDWIRKYPEEVQSIAASGHELGNHSDTHPHVTKLDKEAIKKDIRFAHNELKELTGVDAKVYRPPYGEYNNTVIEAANECQYYTIQWDVDSLDWKEYGKEQLIEKVLKHKNLGSGSIILMHNDTKHTQYALDAIVKGLKQKGYTFVTVSDLILKEHYTIDHTGRQYPET